MHVLVHLGTRVNRLLVDRRSIAVQADGSMEQQEHCKCTCNGRKAEPLPPDCSVECFNPNTQKMQAAEHVPIIRLFLRKCCR